MAVQTLIRHGSEAGYRAELQTDSVCDRCRKGHQMYDRLSRAARTKGSKKPDRYETLDSQWVPSRRDPRGFAKQSQAEQPSFTVQAVPRPRSDRTVSDDRPTTEPVEASTGPAEPSLGDRLADRIRAMTLGAPDQGEFVPEQDTGYVHQIEDADESPGPEWEPAEESEYVITAAGLKIIEQNLGTYLSVVGMTAEMIDPYCGPILAENFDNIVNRWSKVIANYPKAASLFMDGKGGVVFAWIGALQATWPVLYAIYQHHLAKTVMVAPDGRIYNKNQMPNPNGVRPDALQPEFQYSAT